MKRKKEKQSKIGFDFSGLEVWATINDIVSTIALVISIVIFVLTLLIAIIT